MADGERPRGPGGGRARRRPPTNRPRVSWAALGPRTCSASRRRCARRSARCSRRASAPSTNAPSRRRARRSARRHSRPPATLGLQVTGPGPGTRRFAPGDGLSEPQATPATAAMPVLAALAPAQPPAPAPADRARAPRRPRPDPRRTARRSRVARVPARSRAAVGPGRPGRRSRCGRSARPWWRVGDVALTAADWGYAKPRELLFLLVTSPPQTREQLGAALWPDCLGQAARQRAAHRAAGGAARARATPSGSATPGGRYSFNRRCAHDCDVDTFESALAAASRARPAERRAARPAARGRRVRRRFPGRDGGGGVGAAGAAMSCAAGSSRRCSRPAGCTRRRGGTRRRSPPSAGRSSTSR